MNTKHIVRHISLLVSLLFAGGLVQTAWSQHDAATQTQTPAQTQTQTPAQTQTQTPTPPTEPATAPAPAPAEQKPASRAAPEKPLTEETPAPPPPTAVSPVPAPAAAPAGGGGVAGWFARGGKIMWFIAICALAGLMFILERAYTLVKARANTRALMTDVLNAVRREGIPAGERICEQTSGPIAAMVHSGLRQAPKGPAAVEKAIETAGAVEMSFLERGLIWLATISTVAPLLGFLGSVTNLMHAFQNIAAADQVSAKLVAGGIAEALIPTQAGLIVAIPVAIAHNFFLSQIDRFVVQMEESSSELVNTVSEIPLRAGAPARG